MRQNLKKSISVIPSSTIFDIDGVITNPYSKKVNPEILGFLAKQLSSGIPTAIATGRSLQWIAEHILALLQKKVHSKTDMELLYIAGEKGAVTWEIEEGNEKIQVDPQVDFPKPVIQKIKKKVQEFPGLFFDTTKVTMLSIEIQGKNITDEKKQLKQFTHWLKKSMLPQIKNAKPDPGVISVDVQHTTVSKEIFVKKYLSFLQKKGISVQKFLMFGDSPQDADIPQAFMKLRMQSVFIYVGKETLTKTYKFPVVKPGKGKLYDSAVRAILTSDSFKKLLM